MKSIIVAICLTLSTQSFAQNVEVVNFAQLEDRWMNTSDTLYIINYWATWCKPCVEELPDFMKLEDASKNQKIKILLVSLDFASHAETRVEPFIKNKNITPEVVILSDDPNVWINKVDPSWNGEIPATQCIKNNEKKFFAEPLSYEQLQEIVNSFQ